MPDQIKATILPDGTIKLETDRISGPNHISAERLVTEIYTLAGGLTKRTRKANATSHTHGTHTHTHGHGH